VTAGAGTSFWVDERRYLQNVNLTSASLVLPGDTIPAGSYLVNVTVVDATTFLSASDAIPLTMTSLPQISSVSSSYVGRAYSTLFTITTTARGIAPLLYRFIDGERLLSGWINRSSLTFILPEGNRTLKVAVLDARGGISEKTVGQIIVLPAHERNVTANLTRIGQFCENTRIVVANIRSSIEGIADELNEPILRNQAVNYHIYVALEFAINATLNLGGYDMALRLNTLGFDAIRLLPSSDKPLSVCDSITNLNVYGKNGSTDTIMKTSSTVTFSSFANTLWTILSIDVTRVAGQTLNRNGTNSDIIVQAINISLDSNATSPNAMVLSGLTNTLTEVIEVSRPSTLIATKLGSRIGGALDQILVLSSSNQSMGGGDVNQIDTGDICQTKDQALQNMDMLLESAGNALVPFEEPFTIGGTFLKGSVLKAFTASSFRSSNSEISVTIKPSNPKLDPNADTATLAINTVLGDITACRGGGSLEGSMITSVTSSLKYPGKVVLEFRDNGKTHGSYQCKFWDVQGNRWSSRGCRLLEDLQARHSHTCECNHLTEFALLKENLREGKETEKEIAWGYVAVAVIYAVLALLAGETMRKFIGIKKKKLELKKSGFILCQAAFRIPLCILLSTLIPTFTPRSLPKLAVLFIFAVPHSFLWASYMVTCYQWCVISYYSRPGVKRINKLMFEDHIWAYYAGVSVMTMVVWIVCATFIYNLGGENAVITCPVVYFSITLLIAISIAFLGVNVTSSMSKISSGLQLSSIVVRRYALVLSFFMVFQALVWLLSYTMDFSKRDRLNFMIGFYTADIFQIFLQLDHLNGMYLMLLWVKAAVNIEESKSSSTRSGRQTNRSHAQNISERKRLLARRQKRSSRNIDVIEESNEALNPALRSLSHRTRNSNPHGEEEDEISRSSINAID